MPEKTLGNSRARPLDPALLGLWAFLGTATMLFAAFGSAYIVRRSGADWVPVQLPVALWLSTAFLIASSGALEVARLRAENGAGRSSMIPTVLLGCAFVVCQVFAWNQLAAQGVFIPSSPHSSFFYLLTGVHAVHVLGGLAMLTWATVNWETAPAERARRLTLCATYWHFFAAVWVLLLLGMRWG